VKNPHKLVVRRGVVEVRRFLVDKKGVWDPDELYVLGAHHQFVQVGTPLKGEAWIAPELAKVHVKREILKRGGEPEGGRRPTWRRGLKVHECLFSLSKS